MVQQDRANFVYSMQIATTTQKVPPSIYVNHLDDCNAGCDYARKINKANIHVTVM